jgi:hypothetical protein
MQLVLFVRVDFQFTFMRAAASKMRAGGSPGVSKWLENKIVIYKTVIKPVWTYGIELWGCASNFNIEIIQRYQSKFLRILTNPPWYVTNHTLHSDVHIPYVREVFQERIAIHRSAIASHPSPLMAPLLLCRPPDV